MSSGSQLRCSPGWASAQRCGTEPGMCDCRDSKRGGEYEKGCFTKIFGSTERAFKQYVEQARTATHLDMPLIGHVEAHKVGHGHPPVAACTGGLQSKQCSVWAGAGRKVAARQS
jgi:hypothetical protein